MPDPIPWNESEIAYRAARGRPPSAAVAPPVIGDFDVHPDGLRVTITRVAVTSGSNLTFAYHWGDGQTSDTRQHSYDYADIYPVTVTATNRMGASHQITKRIPVNMPPRIYAITPRSTYLDVDVTVGVEFGQDAALNFDWGDGSPQSTTPHHSYPATGTYTIRVTATSIRGSDSRSTEVTVRMAPIVLDYRLRIDHLYVEITDIQCRPGVEAKLAYDWGDKSTTDWPAHGYLQPRPYDLIVTATTAGGESDFAPLREITLYQPAAPGMAAGTPIFRNLPVGPGDLAHLASMAQLDGHAYDVIWRLFESHALKAYAYIDGCDHYAALDDRWHRNYSALNPALSTLDAEEAETLRDHLASLSTGSTSMKGRARRWPGAAQAAWLLLALVSLDDLAEFRIQAEAANSPQARSQGWYRRLADQRIDADLEPAQLWLTMNAASLATRQYLDQREERRRQQRQLGSELAGALAQVGGLVEATRAHEQGISFGSPKIPPVLGKITQLIPVLMLAAQIAQDDAVAVSSEDHSMLNARLPIAATELAQLAAQTRAVASELRDEAAKRAAAYRDAPVMPRPGLAPSPPSSSAVQDFWGYSGFRIGALLIGLITFVVGRGSVVGFLIMAFCGAIVLICSIKLPEHVYRLQLFRADTHRYLTESASHRELTDRYRRNEKYRAELAAAAVASDALAARVAPPLDSLGYFLLRLVRLIPPSFIEQVLGDLA